MGQAFTSSQRYFAVGGQTTVDILIEVTWTKASEPRRRDRSFCLSAMLCRNPWDLEGSVRSLVYVSILSNVKLLVGIG